MDTQAAAKTYQDVQFTVNDRRRTLIMAFEGMIKFLHQASSAIENTEIETAHERLVRTKQILFHLLNGLDMEKGGEIAVNLKRLYIFLIDKVTEANLKKDPAIIDEILPIFKTLCSSWEEMVPHSEKEPPVVAPASSKQGAYGPLPAGNSATPGSRRIQAVG